MLPHTQDFDLRIRNAAGEKVQTGGAYYPGRDGYKGPKPYITIAVTRTRQFPLLDEKQKPYVSKYYHSRVEVLVALLAHEIRHIWQYSQENKIRYPEEDAEEYSVKKLEEWRK